MEEEKKWREKLSEEQYRILREKGTERPFENKYWDCKEKGTYRCVACNHELFDSKTKYDSGSGWPSFWEAKNSDDVVTKEDNSIPNVSRIEVLCTQCNSHLGHKFKDGPDPTGIRFCINSAALNLDQNT